MRTIFNSSSSPSESLLFSDLSFFDPNASPRGSFCVVQNMYDLLLPHVYTWFTDSIQQNLPNRIDHCYFNNYGVNFFTISRTKKIERYRHLSDQMGAFQSQSIREESFPSWKSGIHTHYSIKDIFLITLLERKLSEDHVVALSPSIESYGIVRDPIELTSLLLSKERLSHCCVISSRQQVTHYGRN